MNVFATMGQLYTERLLESKYWSNFKVNLKFISKTKKTTRIIREVDFQVKVLATVGQLCTEEVLQKNESHFQNGSLATFQFIIDPKLACPSLKSTNKNAELRSRA
jgi:hypothetical protein